MANRENALRIRARFRVGNIVHRKFGLLKLYRNCRQSYFKTCHLVLDYCLEQTGQRLSRLSLSLPLSRRGCSSREKCAVCIRKGPLEYFTRDLEKSNAPNYLFPVVSRIASIPLPLFFQSVKHESIVVHANYFRYTRQTLLFRLVIRLKFSSFGGCMIFCV